MATWLKKLFSGTSCHFNTMLSLWWWWWSLELLLLFHMFVNPPSLPILSFSCATKATGMQDGGSSNVLECKKRFLKTCHFTKTRSFQQQWNQKSATGVSLWKNEATVHSHAQWTKSVQWCLVDQARFCVSSFLHQVHCDPMVFLWCFFCLFALKILRKGNFLTLPPSKHSQVVWAAAPGQSITQCLDALGQTNRRTKSGRSCR